MIAKELRLSPTRSTASTGRRCCTTSASSRSRRRSSTRPGRPTDEEWQFIRSHPELGARLAEPLRAWLGEWADAISDHHERWDGKGYPRGIEGDDISLAGRIVAVADVFDVITSARSYKEPGDAVAARDEIARCAGAQFDPRVVRAFLSISLGRLRLAMGPLSWLAQAPILGRMPLSPGIATVGELGRRGRGFDRRPGSSAVAQRAGRRRQRGRHAAAAARRAVRQARRAALQRQACAGPPRRRGRPVRFPAAGRCKRPSLPLATAAPATRPPRRVAGGPGGRRRRRPPPIRPRSPPVVPPTRVGAAARAGAVRPRRPPRASARRAARDPAPVPSSTTRPSFTAGADQRRRRGRRAAAASRPGPQAIAAGPAARRVRPSPSRSRTTTRRCSRAGGQPAVAADGTLTYTPAADASGTATVTLRAVDDGGTADGGADMSAAADVRRSPSPPSTTCPPSRPAPPRRVFENAGAQSVPGVGDARSRRARRTRPARSVSFARRRTTTTRSSARRAARGRARTAR